MQPEELDNALEELETRLERLRALYEQYFLGIEKVEPAVARKDVDRRIWILRRVQIRNTARRFKLQTLIQRYNTFQQYWARICREIENGTYTRHVLKAQKTLGAEPKTWAAKKRFGRNRRETEADAIEAAPPENTNAAVAAVAPSLDAGSDPFAAALSAATIAAQSDPSVPAATAAPSSKAPIEPLHLDLDLDSADDNPPPRPKRAVLPLPKPKQARAAMVAPPAPGQPSEPERRDVAPIAAVPSAAGPGVKSAAGAAEPIGLSEHRIQELHAELLAVKKQLNQPSNVSVEGLAKSLRATAEKIRQKAEGRPVDFEVVVKDGQAVVRPIVRK